MLQCRERPRLTLEARHPVGLVGEDFGNDLQGDVAPKTRVAGAIHLPHAAGPERPDDNVGAQTGSGRE